MPSPPVAAAAPFVPNVTELGAVTVTAFWLSLFTVRVAAVDVAATPQVAVTTARYCLPLSVPLTDERLSVAVVAPLTIPPSDKSVQFAPLSELTCHLYVKLVPDALTLNEADCRASLVLLAGFVAMDAAVQAGAVTVNGAAILFPVAVCSVATTVSPATIEPAGTVKVQPETMFPPLFVGMSRAPAYRSSG